VRCARPSSGAVGCLRDYDETAPGDGSSVFGRVGRRRLRYAASVRGAAARRRGRGECLRSLLWLPAALDYDEAAAAAAAYYCVNGHAAIVSREASVYVTLSGADRGSTLSFALLRLAIFRETSVAARCRDTGYALLLASDALVNVWSGCGGPGQGATVLFASAATRRCDAVLDALQRCPRKLAFRRG
jgi:hypothetical protein